MQIWVLECCMLFEGTVGRDLYPQFLKIVSTTYLLHVLSKQSQISCAMHLDVVDYSVLF